MLLIMTSLVKENSKLYDFYFLRMCFGAIVSDLIFLQQVGGFHLTMLFNTQFLYEVLFTNSQIFS